MVESSLNIVEFKKMLKLEIYSVHSSINSTRKSDSKYYFHLVKLKTKDYRNFSFCHNTHTKTQGEGGKIPILIIDPGCRGYETHV